MALSQAEIESQNTYLLLRREQFRQAASWVADAFAQHPAVERVALFGSVPKPPWKEIPRFHRFRRAGVAVWHECKDVDLAVWVNDLSGLHQLRKTRAQALNDLLHHENIGVAHHQVEVFLLEPGTDRYLGRLCTFGKCPKGKRDCLVPGCGDDSFLQQIEDFVFYEDALDEAIVLYDRNESVA
jgi:hypothetical protein